MCNDHLGGGKGGKEREYSLSTWCPFSLRTHSHRFPSFQKKGFIIEKTFSGATNSF